MFLKGNTLQLMEMREYFKLELTGRDEKTPQLWESFRNH